MWKQNLAVALMAIPIVLAGTEATATGSGPWDPLLNDSWINYTWDPQGTSEMYTVNAGTYPYGFDQKGGKGARGMNALKFAYDANNTGHMIAGAFAGAFDIQNTGDNRTFADLLLLIVIDHADPLSTGFTLQLEPNGIAGDAIVLGPDDFTFYDHSDYHTGRPSGYYSATDPNRENLTYVFDTGLVCLCALQNVNLSPTPSGAPPFSHLNISYRFEQLPGPAVFAVYGYDADNGWIYHTNRARAEGINMPSTFAVLPGDLNGDAVVDARDLALLARYWLQDDTPADINVDHLTGLQDFLVIAQNWLRQLPAESP